MANHFARVDKLWAANNDGATLVAQGRYQEAFMLLRSAIDQTATDPSKIVEEDITYDAFGGIGVVPLSAPRINCMVEGECVLHHDVFPLPFAIYPKHGVAMEDSTASLLAGTAVTLFNMALSRHRQFFLSPLPALRRVFLDEARGLYQTIHEMLAHIPLDPDDPITQLYLVSCCNLIHVCAEYGAVDSVEYWKHELVEGFACVSTEHPGGTFQFMQRVCAYCSISTVSAGAA